MKKNILTLIIVSLGFAVRANAVAVPPPEIVPDASTTGVLLAIAAIGLVSAKKIFGRR